MDEYTPSALRGAVDSIRNPFAASTREQELLVFDAVEHLADLIEGQAAHDAEVARKTLEDAADVCQRIQDDPEFPDSGTGVVAAKIVLQGMARAASISTDKAGAGE